MSNKRKGRKMSVVTVETKLDRGLKARARRRAVTIDDAVDILKTLKRRANFKTIRRVLRKPNWTPVSWHRTKKASRHGRPIRGWKPVV